MLTLCRLEISKSPGDRGNGPREWPNLNERSDMSDGICSADECENESYCRGFCRKHYTRWYRANPPAKLTREERFWAKVGKFEGCWIWNAYCNDDGYGVFKVGPRTMLAHRFAYELAIDAIPPGMEVDHACHTPACVRPTHLRLATRKQNNENLPGARRGSKSGARGVWPRGNRWVAYVGHQRRQVYCGCYGTIEEAAEAARLKRLELFTHSDMDLVEAG